MSKSNTKSVRKKALYIIGCGGVGSAFAPPVLRWNSFESYYDEVHLIDGDSVELKNLERQNFAGEAMGENKAQTLKKNSVFGGYKVEVHPEYINSKILLDKIDKGKENHIVMGVDNMKTRKEVNDAFNKLDNAVVISCGNEFSDGNIQVAIRKDGKAITPDLTCCHKEIEFPKDKSPLELGCMDMVEAAPQLIFANITAATLAMNALYGIIKGTLKPPRDIYFDIPSCSFARAEFPIEEPVEKTKLSSK